MKFLIPLAAVLTLASVSMAAIEFSEDVATTTLPEGSVILASDFKAAEGSAPDASALMANRLPSGDVSNAAVTSAQSTGSSGSTGSVTGIRGGGVRGMLGGGGGGGRQQDDEGGSDDLLAAEEEVAQASNDEDGDETSIEPVAMPEPTTAVVWSILAACGVFAFRRRE